MIGELSKLTRPLSNDSKEVRSQNLTCLSGARKTLTEECVAVLLHSDVDQVTGTSRVVRR